MARGDFYPAPEPVQRLQRVLPQTGGAQPPRSRPSAAALMALLTPQPDWPAQRGAQVAPLTLRDGMQPPRTSAPLAFQPRVEWSAQSEGNVAPLVQVIQSAPPFRRDAISQIGVDWPAQSESDVAPLVPAPVAAFIAYRRDPTPWVVLEWPVRRAGAAAPIAPVVAPVVAYRRDPAPWVVLDWPASTGARLVQPKVPPPWKDAFTVTDASGQEVEVEDAAQAFVAEALQQVSGADVSAAFTATDA